MSPQTTSALFPNAYFRKKIRPFSEASISIASHSLLYGTLCFGGIRGYVRGKKVHLLRLYDHYVRLSNSVKILGMDFELTWDFFQKTVCDLVRANSPEKDCYIRPMVFAENPELVPRFYGLNFDLAMYMMPLEFYFDPNKGLKMMVSSWKKISDSMISTKAKAGGGYLNSAMAKSEAKRCGYDEALMMDEYGAVVEASVANIFVVYRDRVLMPELGSDMLEGITRRTVIEFLKQDGIEVYAERIDRSMVYTCDELLLTGTAAQVTYASEVDGRIIRPEDVPGPICQRLRTQFSELIEGRHPKSAEWLTTVDL